MISSVRESSVFRLPHLLGVVAFAWATTSLSWSPGGQEYAAFWLSACLCGYLIGVYAPSLRLFWFTLPIFLCLNGAYALYDFYRFGSQSYGLFGNPNFFACALALAVAACIGYRMLLYLPPLCGLLWWTQSRGAIVAAGLTALIGLWRYSRLLSCLGFAGAAVAAYFSKTYNNGAFVRLGIWQDTIEHLTIRGNGFGSFLASYESWPVHRNLFVELAPHSYNDYLELLFDLGLGSALVLFFVAACLDSRRHRPSQLIAFAFAATGLTFFPFWVTGPLFTMTLGHLTRKE